MKRLTIINTHGSPVTDLRIQEKQENNAFFRTRIMAVRLVMQGNLGKEAAEICGIHRQSVSEYVKRFNEGGMDLLLERKMAPGRACFLTDDRQQALKEMILTSTPTNQGLGSAVSWTTPIIQEYLRRTYDVEMSTTGVLRMLWRLKLSYTRPTYTLKKADSNLRSSCQRNRVWNSKRLNRGSGTPAGVFL